MNSTFKKVALASALMAGTALVAPQVANAAASVTTAVGTALTVQAPFKTALTPGYGMKARVQVTRNGTTTNQDGMRLYAFLYKSGTYVGYVRSTAADGAAADAVDQTVTLPTAALDYNQVSFAFLYEGGEGGGAVDDTLDGANANVRVLLLTPPAARTAAAGGGNGLSAVDVSGITGGSYTTSGATSTQADNIGALATIKAAAVAVTNYNGPTLLTAQTANTLNGTDLKLTFDTSLKAIADNSVVPAPQIKINSPTITTQQTKGAVTAGDKVVRFDDNNGAFNGQLTTVDVKFVADPSLANFISDEAGNGPVTSTGTAITAFAAPAFAGKTADVLITGGTAFDTNAEITSLFSSAGKTLANGETIVLQLNAAENFDGTGANVIEDVAITGNGTLVATLTGFGANTNAIGVTLTAAGNEVITVDTDGTIKVNGTALTVAMASHTTKLTTAEGKTLDANTAAKKVFLGVAPPTVTLKTLDANANGTLDGAQVDYGAALTTPLAATHGVVIEKQTDATTKAAVTVSVDSATPNVLRAVAPEATLEGFLGTGQTKAANLNTGVTGVGLPFKASVTSSDITYAKIYDAATGANKKIANVAAAQPGTDGAKPVVTSVQYLPEEGTSPAAGQLKIVASEALTAGNLDSAQILLGGSSLQLLNLNDGVKALVAGDKALSKTDVTNDTATIGVLGTNQGKVTASVLNKALTLNANTTAGFADAAGNILATDGSKTVTPGTTVYAGPSIVQAIGTRSANAVGGNIDTVIVKFNKGVALAAGGAKEDGMFKVRGTVGGTDYDVSIPAANIDITQAASGYVTLTIPSPGIKGTLTNLVVEYNAGVQAAANKLVSTDTTPANIAEAGAEFTSANDADTRTAQFSKNSTKLYTMEVKGTLTTDGTAVTPKGTIVRADLVDFASALEMKGASLNVPCQCTGASGVAVPANNDIATLVDNDRKLGKASSKAFVEVTLSARQDSVSGVRMLDAHPGNLNTTRVYEVAIDTKTGAVTGNGVTGSVTLSDAPSLTVLDTVYQVTNDGKFRFAIGSDTAPKNAFVLASVKRPDGDMFTAITSPVTSFSNHVPFASNVTASGVISGDLGTVNLSKIYDTPVRAGNNWQLVGFKGEIARTTDAKRKTEGVSLDRLLISVKGTTGQPVTAWTYDNNDNDEGFLLLNNATKSALQIGTTTIDNVKDVNGGLALALKNGGDYNQDNADDLGVLGNNQTIDATPANSFNIFYPISGNASEYKAEAAKWSLLTMEAGVADIATWANTNKVGAIIVVGAGNQQKAWFKGATDNTLTSLANGDRAFVFFEGANTTYKYGR